MLELIVAVLVAVGIMIAVGTVVKDFLGMPQVINFDVQLISVGVVGGTFFTVTQTFVMIAIPIIVHVAVWALRRWAVSNVASGDWGQEAQWGYELFMEGDEEFLEAAEALPPDEVTEVKIIAESKEELRELIIERYQRLK